MAIVVFHQALSYIQLCLSRPTKTWQLLFAKHATLVRILLPVTTIITTLIRVIHVPYISVRRWIMAQSRRPGVKMELLRFTDINMMSMLSLPIRLHAPDLIAPFPLHQKLHLKIGFPMDFPPKEVPALARLIHPLLSLVAAHLSQRNRFKTAQSRRGLLSFASCKQRGETTQTKLPRHGDLHRKKRGPTGKMLRTTIGSATTRRGRSSAIQRRGS